MILGVAKETFPGERRVALIPASIPPLVKAGLEVRIQRGAGTEAGYLDDEFAEKGAALVDSRDEIFAADCVVQVRSAGANAAAGQEDLARMRKDQTIIGMCDPLGAAEAAQSVAERGVSLFALELIPRITRAQSMDVLSSMATIAGYRAVLLAATSLNKIFPMMMTAAGTLAPARVFVIGAGVAGLQAIATARRLGAIVEAYDVRPAVKEQVESLGAKFVEMELETGDAEGKGGYARQMDEEFYRQQRELMAQVVARSDVVVTTAAIPGRASPLLITSAAVEGMPPGGVIVDLAAERGGNCELSEPDQTVQAHEITIMGPTNLPAEIPYHASQMYAKNMTTFLAQLIKDGNIELDLDDEIVRDTLVARSGRLVNARMCEVLNLEPPEAEPSGDETAASEASDTIPLDGDSEESDSNESDSSEAKSDDSAAN